MQLRTAALLVMIGILLTSLIRLMGTFLPDVLAAPGPVLLTIILQLLSDMAMITFFIVFRTSAYTNSNSGLSTAATIGATGAAVGMLVPLKGLLFHTKVLVFLPLLLTRSLQLLAPLITIISILYFLVVLLPEATVRGNRRLVAGIQIGLGGAALFLLMHLLVVLNFVIHYQFNWLSQISHWVALATLPFIVTATLALLYFFFIIWSETEKPRINTDKHE